MILLLVPAGWKLTPMVGAMYSPELYTGMTKGLTSTGGDKTTTNISHVMLKQLKNLFFLPSLLQCRASRTQQQQQLLPPLLRPFEVLIFGVVPGLSTVQSGQLCHSLPSLPTQGKHTHAHTEMKQTDVCESVQT